MKFLGHRIGDKLVLRMVKRFLKAGIVEDGELLVSEEGAPQGSLSKALDKEP
jgi:retron-type reverse transcriptase